MDDTELQAALKNDRWPRSAGCSARWLVDNAMGPNPVWLAEWLSQTVSLEPGMRVLDLGCGKALTSIFLAREFGVEVWATDLWIDATSNAARVAEAGLTGRVHAIHADAHALPYADGFFDAMVSVDAYHYFGTDELYLGYISKFVKPGGQLGIVMPGLAEEQDALPPAHLVEYWKWDFLAFHSPGWWRRHWERTGKVTVEVADWLADGWKDWLHWDEVCNSHWHSENADATEEAEMLRADAGRLLGFSRAVARRN